MKQIRNTIIAIAGLLFASCNLLELGAIDQWSINNYWNTPEQCERFMTGLHYRLQQRATVLMQMGELRGGTLSTEGVTSIGETASDIAAVTNQLAENTPVLSNWGDFYMDIYQMNHAIENIEGGCEFLSLKERSTYLGQLYGLRAFYYFHMLRTWGGVPLCDKPDVLHTNDMAALNKERSSEAETFRFILQDARTSCAHYAELDYSNYKGANCYWNKAASQCLKAEVLLWGAKVKPIGGDAVLSADPAADLTEAVNALTEVESLYAPNAKFIDAFSPLGKDANLETVLAIRYVLNESSTHFVNFTYNPTLFTKYYDAAGNKIGNVLNIASGFLRYEYSQECYDSFDAADTRRDATFLQFYLKDNDNNIYPAGRALRKFLGETNNGKVQYTNDIPLYRYMDIALMLAEAYNEQDNASAVTVWIEKVRSRAYGASYPRFTYTSKEAAEEAILAERTKEFIAEGKRWYDVRRMLGGKYAIELVNDDMQKLLWPIDAGVLSKDSKVKQNPGYIITDNQ